MKLTVKYFGMIAEWAGSEQQSVQLEGSTVKDLRDHLEQVHPSLQSIRYQVAVNRSLAADSDFVHEQDELALLPPFAGG